MSKTIALVNQKGGVGKTASTASLGIGLALQGKKVLLIDFDPQASLTDSLGYKRPDDLFPTISDMLEKTISQKRPPHREKESFTMRRALIFYRPILSSPAWR